MSAVVQGSAEWLAQRVGRFGGTAVGVLDGVNQYRSSADLIRTMVRELAGAESEFKMVPAVEHGMKMEAVAQRWYENQFNCEVIETDFVNHPNHEFLGASPDGLVATDEGLVGGIEIKCPYPRFTKHPYSVFDAKKAMYLAQVHMVMEVCDLQWIDFICYLAVDEVSEPKVNVERVHRNKKWLHEPMDGSLLPNPSSSRVPRIDLYIEWHEYLMAEYNDPERRSKHLDPVAPDYEKVSHPDFELLTQTMIKLQQVQASVAAELTTITLLNTEKDRLKRLIAAEFDRSVTDGETRVQVINKKAQFDFKKAFEALGGEDELAKRKLPLEDFEKAAGRQQVTVKFGE